jgi:hypothetical protein
MDVLAVHALKQPLEDCQKVAIKVAACTDALGADNQVSEGTHDQGGNKVMLWEVC